MDSGSETTRKVSSGSSSLDDEESGRSSRGPSISSLEELDSAVSAKNISYSPFSLSINKKISMSKVEGVSSTVGSSLPSSATAQLKDIASPSLAASLLKDPNMSPKKQVQELQRELASLKKEMDSKDAKLSSSMRSIKMFWSPELKKERALRKEETEKFVTAREQLKKMKEECQKRSKKVKDLEAQLETEQRLNKDHLLSEQQVAEQRETEAAELERIKEEKGKYQDENVLLQKLVSELEENVKNLAEGLERSKSTLDSVVSEKADAVREKDSATKALDSVKEEIETLRTTLKLKGEENTTLKKSIEQLQSQEMKLRNSLDTKTSEVSDLKKQITQYKDEVTELKRERDRRLKQKMVEEDSQEMLRNEVMALQMRLDSFETNAAVKDAEIVSLQSVIDSLQSKSGVQVDKAKQLETALSTQNMEVKNLEDEVRSLTTALSEKESLVRQKEDHITSLTLSSNRRDTQLEELREAMEKKRDEIKRMDAKYEKLDNYVCEREKALAQSREEVNHLRSAHSNCSTTISVLEGQLREKEDLLAQLTLDYEKMERENGELGDLRNTDSQGLEQSDSAHGQKSNEDIIRQLESKANELTMKLEEQESNIENLNRVLETKDRTIEDLTKEIRKAQDAISKLEDEVNSRNSKIKDLEGENMVTKDDNKENVRPSSQGPQSRTSKQLLEDIAKKDAKISDLEKQLKDKSKLLSVRRRSETTERGKEAQQFSEQLKQNDEVKAKLAELQDQLEKKDDRIVVLEDALRESVSIAAEREDLLAQHVEMSEKAARRIQELESEVDRATMEKAITNIKNAFLILSVSEKDSVLAMFKANRRKNLEELLNLKQRALEACISEKDINIAYLEQITSSKTKKQEAKMLMQEKARLLSELKEQTQIRMTLLNNEENKEGSLAKELSDGTRDQILEALRQVTDSSDKLEFYIEDLLTFIKEKNLELLKEMPTLPQRHCKAIDRLKNCGKNELLKELERLGHESGELKGYVDSILDKLEG